MSTDVEVYSPRGRDTLPAKVQYARELANSGLLPGAYRRNPANVLYAVEYGDMLGLSPMAAITGIHVIEGKPSASAGLISALVRRAGHKLRLTGDDKKATCQIIRSDDPDYTFEVTFTLADAQKAGLAGKQVWKQYTASMLKSRAITQCARDACEEAMYGLHYTPEELGAEVDAEGNAVGEIVPDEKPAGQNGQANGGRRDPTPADDPWYVHPDPEGSGDPEWDARAKAFTTDDEGRKLWAQTVKWWQEDKTITEEEAGRLQGLLKARWRELHAATQAEPVDATVVEPLDPEDPWAARVEEIGSQEDADACQVEVTTALGDGEIDAATADQIRAAIAAREASLSEEVPA